MKCKLFTFLNYFNTFLKLKFKMFGFHQEIFIVLNNYGSYIQYGVVPGLKRQNVYFVIWN